MRKVSKNIHWNIVNLTWHCYLLWIRIALRKLKNVKKRNHTSYTPRTLRENGVSFTRGGQWVPGSLPAWHEFQLVPTPHHFITWLPVTTCAQQALGTTHVSPSPPSRQALPAGRSRDRGQNRNVFVAKYRPLPPHLRCSPPASHSLGPLDACHVGPVAHYTTKCLEGAWGLC